MVIKEKNTNETRSRSCLDRGKKLFNTEGMAVTPYTKRGILNAKKVSKHSCDYKGNYLNVTA